MIPQDIMNDPARKAVAPASWQQVSAWRTAEIPSVQIPLWREASLTLLFVIWCTGLALFGGYFLKTGASLDRWLVWGICLFPAVALSIWLFRQWRWRLLYGRPVFRMATWPGTNAQGEMTGTIVIPRQRLPFTNPGKLELICRDERQVAERVFATTVWDSTQSPQPAPSSEGLAIPVIFRIPEAAPDASPNPKAPLRFLWLLRFGPEGTPAELEFFLPMFRE